MNKLTDNYMVFWRNKKAVGSVRATEKNKMVAHKKFILSHTGTDNATGIEHYEILGTYMKEEK